MATARDPRTRPQDPTIFSVVEDSIEVDVPVRTAYDQWTLFEQFPEFMEHVDRIVQIDPALTRWTVRLAGVTRDFDAIVTEQTPDQRIAWTTVDGEADHSGVVTFHALDDDRTKVVLQMEWDPEGLVENAAAATGVFEVSVRNDLEEFKRLIEARGEADWGWRGTIERDGTVHLPEDVNRDDGGSVTPPLSPNRPTT